MKKHATLSRPHTLKYRIQTVSYEEWIAIREKDPEKSRYCLITLSDEEMKAIEKINELTRSLRQLNHPVEDRDGNPLA